LILTERPGPIRCELFACNSFKMIYCCLPSHSKRSVVGTNQIWLQKNLIVVNVGSDEYPDHNFLRFLPIFGKKMAFFSKTNVMITIFSKTSSSLSKKRQYFRWIFRRKYFKNHNIGPRITLEQINTFFCCKLLTNRLF
jgi:hypothetical protein